MYYCYNISHWQSKNFTSAIDFHELFWVSAPDIMAGQFMALLKPFEGYWRYGTEAFRRALALGPIMLRGMNLSDNGWIKFQPGTAIILIQQPCQPVVVYYYMAFIIITAYYYMTITWFRNLRFLIMNLLRRESYEQ